MKALVYRGPRDVRVEDVPDAKIEKRTDVLVRMTSTTICGSDLHMYEGRTSVENGKVLGHENLGVVIEVGSAVDQIKKGDHVALPFNIGCGFCRTCERGFSGFCLTTNPDPETAGAAYGYADMGPYNGGQAEYLRVPYADFNCLRLPKDDAEEKEDDYVMLTDVFPTGWHATEMASVAHGDTLVVHGAGPVGSMTAYSAVLRGATKVFIVDRHPDRLKLAEAIGAAAIDDSKEEPVERVQELTGGKGAKKGCECVGWQAHDPSGHEHPNQTLNRLVASVRATGAIGGGGVFLLEDPNGTDKMVKEGQLAFDYGTFFTKRLRMGTGQANVKRYNRELLDLIHVGKAKPSWIVSHRLHLHEAADAYKHFDARENGTRVVLKPGKRLVADAGEGRRRLRFCAPHLSPIRAADAPRRISRWLWKTPKRYFALNTADCLR